MNIKDLKEIIKDLPDDLSIGYVGHWDDFNEISEDRFRRSTAYINQSWIPPSQGEEINIFEILMF